ncbi:MAG: glycosyltransferase family 2 protein [Prevotella sp.]|nr:glycosyltransferase family 2 protein [Candidatus Prevotella equi]
MISIIIPLYNKYESISRAIDSVMSQTYCDWELVVIDDGSTDDSKDIVASYTDPRIKYYYQTNAGVSTARNNGVEKANGEWIVFLDADDYLTPEALEIFIGLYNEFGTGFCAANYKVGYNGEIFDTVSKRRRGILENNYKSWYFHEYYPGRMSSFMVKRDLVLKHKFRGDLTRYEDCEVMFRILRECKVSYSDNITMVYMDDYKGLSNRAANPFTDFAFNLPFRDASFWQRMVLIHILRSAFHRYPELKLYLFKKYPDCFVYITIDKILKRIYC